jgi:amino-acid N-acetyltransferase
VHPKRRISIEVLTPRGWKDHRVSDAPFFIRRARVKDVPAIQGLVAPLVAERILLGKDSAVFYGAVQEFRIAEDSETGAVVGCGALHVMWDDLAEIRTLAVDTRWRRRRVGHALVEQLERDAGELGVNKLFCLTFEVDFFAAHGYARTGRRRGAGAVGRRGRGGVPRPRPREAEHARQHPDAEGARTPARLTDRRLPHN